MRALEAVIFILPKADFHATPSASLCILYHTEGSGEEGGQEGRVEPCYGQQWLEYHTLWGGGGGGLHFAKKNRGVPLFSSPGHLLVVTPKTPPEGEGVGGAMGGEAAAETPPRGGGGGGGLTCQ